MHNLLHGSSEKHQPEETSWHQRVTIIHGGTAEFRPIEFGETRDREAHSVKIESMPRRSTSVDTRRARTSRKRRSSVKLLTRFVPKRSTRRRWWKKYRRASPRMQIAIGMTAIVAVWFAANLTYQVVRKPTELFFPVSGTLYKSPEETWRAYAPIFRKHSTAVITPELLAALAQIEGSGNPVARTYWRWSFTRKPFEVYKPASSAVGMLQITDGTFDEARRLCIHDHVVVEDGPWDAWRSCWFNGLYFRVVPSHAVELTSAYLDRKVANILAARRTKSLSLPQKQTLATLIHLCGAGAGEKYARRGYQLLPRQRCGDHSAASYVARVNSMQNQFKRLANARRAHRRG